MPDISSQYEREHLRNLITLNKRIRRIYEKAIQEIQVNLATVTYNGKLFNLNDYPLLRQKIEAVSKQMQAGIYAATINGIDESWFLSNKKNSAIVDKRLIGSRIKKSLVLIWYDTNKKALDAFKVRVEKGLTLSDRVWKSLNSLQPMLEQTVGLGIGVGEPAREIASNIKKYLKEPDKLFRRVRKDGKLYLSAKARNYHPGTGVYRSSFQNALRLSATETNVAYRLSDHLRWQKMSIVIGQEIKTSNSHPKFDLCDQLKGIYPKDFIWKIWHPRCLCFKVPVLMKDKDFLKIEDAILAGQPAPVFDNAIKTVPASFNKFLNDNAKRIKGWKSTPYFISDNPGFVK